MFGYVFDLTFVVFHLICVFKMKELELFDSELQKSFKLIVTDENYDEIVLNGDLALATRLLQKDQEKKNFIAAFNLMRYNEVETGETSAKSPSNNTSRGSETPENTKIWTDEATKCLIELCKKYENEFESGVKKYVWNKIARQISEKCKQVYSIQQCDTKWKGLKNMYKQIKKCYEQSGNNRKIWKYFDLMDEILFSRSEINATVTCSSKTGLIINDTPSPNVGIPDVDDDSNEEPHVEVQTPTFQSSFMRKRRHTDNAAERRHKEKMTRQDRYLELLERLTTAVERSVNNSLEEK